MESKNQISEPHNDMECPHSLSDFIANAPLEGDFYRQIRADIAECERLEATISAEIIDRDAFCDLEEQGNTWRPIIEDFRHELEAFASAEKLLDPASGLRISDDLERAYLGWEVTIQGFCEDVRKYKYRISRIIRLPLYVHCLALSQRRPFCQFISSECIRDANLPDIPRVGEDAPAVDKDTLLKHLTELHRVDSVVKEWMFTAKIVKSAVAIRDVGWSIDHLKLFDQIERWYSERRSLERTKRMQEALEEATKQKEEFKKKFQQKCEVQRVSRLALDHATRRQEELQAALDQANKQQEGKHEALEQEAKQAREALEQATEQVREVQQMVKESVGKILHAGLIWLLFVSSFLYFMSFISSIKKSK